MPSIIHSSKCTGCGVCVGLCPYGVIAFDDEGEKVRVIAASRCVNCFMCEDNCRFDAITVRIPSVTFPYWPLGMEVSLEKE